MALSTLPKVCLQLLNARKQKILVWPWFTAVGLLVASRGFPPLLPTATIVASMVAISTCVYIYNDVIDLEMDRLNPEKVNRPLPSGRVSVREAMRVIYISGFVGLALLFFTNIPTFLLAITYMALFLAYSNPRIRLKKRFIFHEGTHLVACFIAPLIGGMAIGSISPVVIFAGAFMATLALAGDAAFNEQLDIEEDKKYGIKTLAMVLSWKTKIEMVIIFVLAFMTLTPLTYVQLQLNIIFPIVVVALCLLVLRFLFPLLSAFEAVNYRRAYKTLYGMMVLVQVSLIVGSFPLIF